MQAMIGLPSGGDRVRWNPSAISPQPSTTPRIVAPRAMACARLSSTSAPAPSAITKPSRSLENGRAAASGGSLRVDSAESREKRIRLSGFTERRCRPQRRLGLAAPDRLDAELDGGRARRAGGRGRHRRALGAEAVGQVLGHRAEQEPFVAAGELPARRGAQQVVIVDRLVRAGRGGQGPALRPLHLDRRQGQEQRAGKIARRPMPASATASSVTSRPAVRTAPAPKAGRPARNPRCRRWWCAVRRSGSGRCGGCRIGRRQRASYPACRCRAR